jgi:ribosome-associated heat shock protein Hsp15
MSEGAGGRVQRIDQWLWFARIAKSRTLAQALVDRGKVRINRDRVGKPSASVKPGDVLTLMLGPNVRVLEILGIGARRGPASEAQLLYRDLAPPPSRAATSGTGSVTSATPAQAVRPDGAGRPTKRERRETDRLKGR